MHSDDGDNVITVEPPKVNMMTITVTLMLILALWAPLEVWDTINRTYIRKSSLYAISPKIVIKNPSAHTNNNETNEKYSWASFSESGG